MKEANRKFILYILLYIIGFIVVEMTSAGVVFFIINIGDTLIGILIIFAVSLIMIFVIPYLVWLRMGKNK